MNDNTNINQSEDVMSPKLREVVDFFIMKSKEEGQPLTNKKLQKLIYYAQAWNLVFNGEKLFDESIEAWIHGPVIPPVYRAYKKYGAGAITEDVEFDKNLFTKDELSVLDDVWSAYGKFDGDYLEILTHSEDPWSSARGDAELHERSTSEIDPRSMKEFYAKKLDAVAA